MTPFLPLLTTFTGGKSKIEGPAFAMICRFYKIISPSKALRIERMHIICITLLHTIEALRMTEISCADAHSIRKQKFSPLERIQFNILNNFFSFLQFQMSKESKKSQWILHYLLRFLTHNLIQLSAYLLCVIILSRLNPQNFNYIKIIHRHRYRLNRRRVLPTSALDRCLIYHKK